MASFGTLGASFPKEFTDKLKNESLLKLVDYLLVACSSIGKGLREVHFTSEAAGSTNSFGDHQLDVDLKTDAIIFEALRTSGVVSSAASEENPYEVSFEVKDPSDSFSVAFDPLDGSSIVDANFAVGSIVGIWPGNGLLNRTGREQCCSFIVQYGPRITVAIAFSGQYTTDSVPIALELTLASEQWFISKPQLTIAHKGNTFAPGNLRATADNSMYHALVKYWIENKYTLRYSGGLVPDVYHILIKAFLVETAGGSSCYSPSELDIEKLSSKSSSSSAPPPLLSILDVPVSDLDKRVGVCYGSRDEVDRFWQFTAL
eukprot:gene30680-39960_t